GWRYAVRVLIRGECNLADWRLKGLEDYSSDQLFFISAAQMWCANFNEKELKNYLKYSVHTPEYFRINGIVRNNADFAEIFKCDEGSQMFSEKKCKLW
ncbi:Neprilysin-2, partial [Armadillidium vulgare]